MNYADLWKRPEELIKQVKGQPITVKSAFFNNSGHLRKVSESQGISEVKMAISLAIIDLLEFFNSTETLSVKQIGDVTNLIFEDNSDFLTIEDIIICFKNVKRKLYKKEDHNWARIQGSDILYWIRIYEDEKVQEIIKIRIEEKGQHYRNESHLPENKQSEQWKELKQRVLSMPEIKHSRPVRNYDKGREAQLKYNQAIEQFKELQKKQNRSDDLIEYGDELMSINEYILNIYQ